MKEKLQHIKQQLQLLVKQYQTQIKENLHLKKELNKKELLLMQQSKHIEQLRQKVDGLKMQGGNLLPEEKVAMQKRIDGYLKEIDICLDILNQE